MKAIVLGFLIILGISCNSLQTSGIEGNWIDKEKEMFSLNIYSEGDHLIAEYVNDKHTLEQTEYGHKFVWRGQAYFINTDESKGIIVMNNKKYIPLEKGKRKYFLGSWESKTAHFKKVDFIDRNGGTLLTVQTKDGKNTKYYPKLVDEGYFFTYKNEDFTFSLDEKGLKDSDGNLYSKK